MRQAEICAQMPHRTFESKTVEREPPWRVCRDRGALRHLGVRHRSIRESMPQQSIAQTAQEQTVASLIRARAALL